MLKAYARLVCRFRVWFLVFGLFCMGASAIYAVGIFSSLSSSGFVAPNSQSRYVDSIVKNDFGGNKSSLVLLFSSKTLKFDNPKYEQAAETVIKKVADLQVVNSTSSYYSTGSPIFISKNPHLTFAFVGLKGNGNQQAVEMSKVLPQLKSPTLKVLAGGTAASDAELSSTVQKDLEMAEKLSIPITAILLVIIFGSITAASLPLALGLYGIIGAFFISRLVTLAMPMSVYVIDIVSLLGLGLGIDYSLFIVNRYREELNKDPNNEIEVLARTVSTAGKTVIFSGLTVMIALAGLIIFPIDYIRSMGIGGAAAVLIAVVGSLLFLPAILALLGNNVNSLRVSSVVPLKWRNKIKAKRNVWEHTAKLVMRYPLLTVIITLGVLIVIGFPFLQVHFVQGSYNVLPKQSSARVVASTLNSKFKYGNQSPLYVLIPRAEIKNTSSIKTYVNKITSFSDVSGLEQYKVNSKFLLLMILPKNSTYSKQNSNLVRKIRTTSVYGIKGLVGGDTADLLDLLGLISHYGVYAIIVVALSMLILFYLLLGSLVIPIKTIVLTTLSLSAAFGVLVLIFQEGQLNGVLGISSLGGLDASQLVIIFSLAFGLSMDYAAFLFSRIREYFDEYADMSLAIVWGVMRTGRIITSAAILLLAVIASFSVGSVISMKEVSFGLIVAIVVDVFVVRLLLVPASMKLLGKYNWWLPKPLKTLSQRIHIYEEDTPVAKRP